jgi:tetratricopeptide (TPR) repeat protein
VTRAFLLVLVCALAGAGCRARESSGAAAGGSALGNTTATPAQPLAATLPRAPGVFAPSLAAIEGGGKIGGGGEMLADIDTCATCHPDVAAQWQSGIHSFASFGNPIYRTNVELARTLLGNKNSQHCGGCHDAPLQVDGAMLDTIAADDLRAHTGVSCRVCHAVRSTTTDGNGSYVLAAGELPTPDVNDAASVEAHRKAVSVKPLGDELCVACHRGFLSPDVDVPVHLAGIDEPTFWRSSAYTGNGTGRVDKVEKKGCIDCHMAEVDAPGEEYSADKKVRGHYFPGGHSWMAAMRDDDAQIERIRAMLVGAASIDVAGAIVGRESGANGPTTLGGRWHLPADGAPVKAGEKVSLDVVVRNRLVGHRFPGGVNDMQDTWIEVEVRDAKGRMVASSGLAHEKVARDEEAHVLRSYPVDDHGDVMEEHQLPKFRAVVANHTVAARDSQTVRYAMDVPAGVVMPLEVRARLRHRSRGMIVQQAVCAESKTAAGRAFLLQARDQRDMRVNPCAAQPVTEVASTRVWMGEGWEAAMERGGGRGGGGSGGSGVRVKSFAPEAAWERMYEHGMGLIGVITERLDEPRQVLEHALTQIPETAEMARPRAMVLVQLGSVLGRQGRTDEAIAVLEKARGLLPAPQPPAIDAIAADALARVWRWEEAERYAEEVTKKAPQNTAAWVMLARARGSMHDDAGALAAAREGLVWSPRDPDLLRSQATALAGLAGGEDGLAKQALAAFDRFRAPDEAAALRIACANRSERCTREREMGHVHVMVQARTRKLEK